MLNKITWTDYLSTAAILVIIYYLVIAALYYRTEIKNLLSGKLKFNNKNISDSDEAAPGEMDEADFDELEAVVGDLKRSVLEQAGKETSKKELLVQLKKRLDNYDGLRQPAYRVAINHFIMQNAKDICGVAFSEEELDAAWKELPR